MRLTTEMLLLGGIAAIASWAGRAPEDPGARAEYLCRPVARVTGALARMDSTMSQDGRVAVPLARWRFDPARACVHIVESVLADPLA